MILVSLMLAQAALPDAVPLPGIWSLGEKASCAAGEAWVFTADGYYVEVTLPASPIHAVGVWEDKGNAIEYTHAHAPFSNLASPQQRRSFKVTARTRDRIELINYKDERRVFHRCPAGSLREEHKK
jgi:hypothetical protein